MKRLIFFFSLITVGLSFFPRISSSQTVEDMLAGREPSASRTIKGEIRYELHRSIIEKNASEGVVKIYVRNYGVKKDGVGTGFYFGSTGLVVTTAHTLGNKPGAVLKTSEGELVEASVVVREPSVNLVLLAPMTNGKSYLPLGRSLHLTKEEELFVITWPGFSHVAPRPNSYGQFMSFPIGMTFGSVKVVKERTGVQPARFWSENRPLIELDTPVNHEWSGSPLLDYSGKVVAIMMGKEDEEFLADDEENLYTIEIRLFGKEVPPVVLESSTPPPNTADSGDPVRTENFWRAWLIDTRIARIPKVEINGESMRIIHDLQKVEDFISRPGRPRIKAEQANAGQAAERTLRKHLPSWLAKPDMKFKPQVSCSQCQNQDIKGPALPKPPDGHCYAIPIEQAKRVFRSWIRI